MVNKYIKALALTVVLSILGLLLIGYVDNARISNISNAIEESSLEIEATQQLLLYESITGDKESVCDIISKRIDSEAEKTKGVLEELERVKAQGFFVDTQIPKMKFLNQNMQLYLLVRKSIQDCENSDIKPVVYFYTDKSFSADEAAQAKILDNVVEQCSEARVFAFPHDLGIPVADVLITKYGISSYPAILIGNEPLEGLVSGELILGKLGCQT